MSRDVEAFHWMITSAWQAQCIQSYLLWTRKSTVRQHQLLRMSVLSVQGCYTHPRRSCLKAYIIRDGMIIRVNCALGKSLAGTICYWTTSRRRFELIIESSMLSGCLFHMQSSNHMKYLLQQTIVFVTALNCTMESLNVHSIPNR